MRHGVSLVLASKSPRRIEILRGLGVDFVSVPADVDESPEGVHPDVLPLLLAERKAAAVAAAYPDRLVVGVDTVVELDGRIYGKPESLGMAGEFLASLSGRRHRVLSGVCVMRRSDALCCRFSDCSLVWFKKLSAEGIRDYHRLVNPLDKAGAYAVQEHGELIIDRLEGAVDNIIGLPTAKLLETLAHLSAAAAPS